MAGYREVSPSGAPFAFYTERRLVVLTGRKARDQRSWPSRWPPIAASRETTP
jgi:hypothetical protein